MYIFIITFSGDFEGDLEIFGILFMFLTLTANDVFCLLSLGGEGEGRLVPLDEEPKVLLVSEDDEPELPSYK